MNTSTATLETLAEAPAIPGPETREHSFRTWDGTQLFYRAWHPGYPRKKALLLFHGGHEHSGRFHELVQRLTLEDVSVFAWDARGHGRSPGARGHAGHFHHFVKDADAFVRHVAAAHSIRIEDMQVLGHSVGSVIIATWLHDYAPPVRGAVLGSPAFDVKLYVPFALPGLRLLQRVRPDASVNSYVKPGMLTHDKAEAEARRNDPRISPKIAVRVLTSLYDTSERVIRGAHSITTPLLLLCAGSDRVVHRGAQTTFFERLGSREKEQVVFPSFYHEIFHEADRHLPIDHAAAFIRRQFEGKGTRAVQPLDAPGERCDITGSRAPWHRRAGYAATRGFLKTAGRLSHGVRLGWQTGFDSGPTLDYVYENHPRGTTPLGRVIDHAYLNSVGWRGIRTRGVNLQASLNEAVRAQLADGRRVHIVDVASGPGRYLLETVRSFDDPLVTATCRDRDTRGLAQGRALAASLGVDRVCYEAGDAFDPRSLAGLAPRPSIVIVSGLYELFPDNELVRRSLHGIHEALKEGGVLIFTNQPWHPQLELIAHTLVNRDGKPWTMRLRSQAEMHGLVRCSGFSVCRTRIDNDGIFSVNVAVKR